VSKSKKWSLGDSLEFPVFLVTLTPEYGKLTRLIANWRQSSPRIVKMTPFYAQNNHPAPAGAELVTFYSLLSNCPAPVNPNR
jgi:hypothetical protein